MFSPTINLSFPVCKKGLDSMVAKVPFMFKKNGLMGRLWTCPQGPRALDSALSRLCGWRGIARCLRVFAIKLQVPAAKAWGPDGDLERPCMKRPWRQQVLSAVNGLAAAALVIAAVGFGCCHQVGNHEPPLVAFRDLKCGLSKPRCAVSLKYVLDFSKCKN